MFEYMILFWYSNKMLTGIRSRLSLSKFFRYVNLGSNWYPIFVFIWTFDIKNWKDLIDFYQLINFSALNSSFDWRNIDLQQKTNPANKIATATPLQIIICKTISSILVTWFSTLTFSCLLLDKNDKKKYILILSETMNY